MTVDRSRIRFLLGGGALVATLSMRAPSAAAPVITVYRDPG